MLLPPYGMVGNRDRTHAPYLLPVYAVVAENPPPGQPFLSVISIAFNKGCQNEESGGSSRTESRDTIMPLGKDWNDTSGQKLFISGEKYPL